MPRPKLQKGQTIIEVLVAAALTALAFVGLLALGSISIRTTSYSRNQNLASSYSSQAADWLRNTRTSFGWGAIAAKLSLDAGANPTVTYCLPTLPTTQAEFIALSPSTCNPSQTIDSTIYLRSITFDLTKLNNNLIKAIIDTKWLDNTNPGARVEVTLGKTE